MLSNCGAGEDSWESPGQQGDQTSQSLRKSTLNTLWRDWCWSSNTLATWCERLTHWKRPWWWERLKAEGEEGDRAGWHRRFNKHELGQTPGDGEGQGNLACCRPRGREESDTTWWLNNNDSGGRVQSRGLRVGGEEVGMGRPMCQLRFFLLWWEGRIWSAHSQISPRKIRLVLRWWNLGGESGEGLWAWQGLSGGHWQRGGVRRVQDGRSQGRRKSYSN